MKAFRDFHCINVVSGLPRSGTSLMMNILSALDQDVFYDDERKSDASNPGGYFESQLVKGIPHGEISFLNEVESWVKITANYIPYICDNFSIKMIYMDRSLEEVARSQSKMIDEGISDLERQVELLAEARERAFYFMRSRLNIDYHVVNYGELVRSPDDSVGALSRFLGGAGDCSRAVAVVDEKLYRNKG